MPRFRSETITTGDQSWLGSTHALYNARSVAPSLTAFPLSTYTTGTVPSGTPLALVAGKAVPYDSGAVTGAEDLVGFLVTDQPAGPNGNGSWPLLDHGRIRVDRLPVSFAAPAAAGLFTYYDGSEA